MNRARKLPKWVNKLKCCMIWTFNYILKTFFPNLANLLDNDFKWFPILPETSKIMQSNKSPTNIWFADYLRNNFLRNFIPHWANWIFISKRIVQFFSTIVRSPCIVRGLCEFLQENNKMSVRNYTFEYAMWEKYVVSK